MGINAFDKCIKSLSIFFSQVWIAKQVSPFACKREFIKSLIPNWLQKSLTTRIFGEELDNSRLQANGLRLLF